MARSARTDAGCPRRPRAGPPPMPRRSGQLRATHVSTIRSGSVEDPRRQRHHRPTDRPGPTGQRAGSGDTTGDLRGHAPVWRAVDGDGGERQPVPAPRPGDGGSMGGPRLVHRGERDVPRTGSRARPRSRSARSCGRVARGHRAAARWSRGTTGTSWVPPAGVSTGAVPQDRLLAINHDYLATLGRRRRRSGLHYDVLPGPVGRSSRSRSRRDRAAGGPACETGWRVRPTWVFATYADGGVGNLQELLHESGHALAAAGLRVRPGVRRVPDARPPAFLEATADILGWDVTESAWQRRWLGDTAEPREALLDRYGAVMLDVCWALFEIVIHDHPEHRPNDVWSEIAHEGLGVVPHPEWSWWAVRGPAHRVARLHGELRALGDRRGGGPGAVCAVRGPWWDGDPGWYAFVAERLFAPGASRSPADLLRDLLGGPLTAEPLLAGTSPPPVMRGDQASAADEYPASRAARGPGAVRGRDRHDGRVGPRAGAVGGAPPGLAGPARGSRSGRSASCSASRSRGLWWPLG